MSNEFVPSILEQDSRRELALTETVRLLQDRFLLEELDEVAGGSPRYLAYQLWADSELFYAGFHSSLALFDASGQRVSHFAFDFPAAEFGPEEAASPDEAEQPADEAEETEAAPSEETVDGQSVVIEHWIDDVYGEYIEAVAPIMVRGQNEAGL